MAKMLMLENFSVSGIKENLTRLAGEAEKVFEKNPKDKNNLLTLGIAYHNLADFGGERRTRKVYRIS